MFASHDQKINKNFDVDVLITDNNNNSTSDTFASINR